MTFVAFNVTSIGASHIRVGKECQDFSYSEPSEPGGVYAMAISCDGHGGDNYFRSAYGSRFAAQSAASCISEFLHDWDMSVVPENPDEILIQLEKSIITKWNIAVWDHYNSNPFTEEELNSVSEHRRKRLQSGKSIESTYGTTLIALVQTQAFWFGVQIGDGKAVRVSVDGTFDQPIPPNEKCFLNSTTSICDENAIEDFRHAFSTDMPAALFCGSDGIDDSFIRDEQLYKLYSTVGRSFVDNSRETACAELEDYLPRLSAKGSGDDVSIAGIVTIELAANAIPAIEEPATAKHADGEAQSEDGESSELRNEDPEQVQIAAGEDEIAPEPEMDSEEVQPVADAEPPHLFEGFIATDSMTESTSPSLETLVESSLGADMDGAPGNPEPCALTVEVQPRDEESANPIQDVSVGFEQSDAMMIPKYCGECGFKFPVPVKFCPECGARVGTGR